MVIVDASVWIDWDRDVSNAELNWLDQAIGVEEIGLTDLILCEVLRGCRDDTHAARLRGELSRVAIVSGAGEDVVQDAARYYRNLRHAGITVASVVDCLTAAFCVRYGHQRLHRDHDYEAFEAAFGLAVIHPGSAA